MRIGTLHDTQVVLIAGGGRVYTDVAARFVQSERSLESILTTSYDSTIVNNILSSGHLAATEFDYFVFGVSGFSRIAETQLVRKRLASYMIKSGRLELHGKRQYDVMLPESIACHEVQYRGLGYTPFEILELLEAWYNTGVDAGLPEEDLRYLKPQATTFKGIIGMNAHALLDWFKIRCCMNAQTEIRHMAHKMKELVMVASPDLFVHAGPSCTTLHYCPENARQHPLCKGTIYTHDQVKELLQRNSMSALTVE